MAMLRGRFRTRGQRAVAGTATNCPVAGRKPGPWKRLQWGHTAQKLSCERLHRVLEKAKPGAVLATTNQCRNSELKTNN